MNVVTGIFTAEEAAAVVNYFTKSGFLPESLAVISSPMEMPAYLDGQPEQAATTGAVAGGVAGGALGALTILVASTIPAFRAMPVIGGSESLVIFGLMTTAVGSVVGGYLGSMYSVRADSEPQINMVELLDTGHVVLMVTTAGGAKGETAVELMHQLGGRQIEIHPLPTENNEAVEYS